MIKKFYTLRNSCELKKKFTKFKWKHISLLILNWNYGNFIVGHEKPILSEDKLCLWKTHFNLPSIKKRTWIEENCIEKDINYTRNSIWMTRLYKRNNIYDNNNWKIRQKLLRIYIDLQWIVMVHFITFDSMIKKQIVVSV